MNIAAVDTKNEREQSKNLQYVVAVDDSACARHAAQWADFLANPNDTITLVHSVETENQTALIKQRYAKYPEDNKKRFALKILDDEDQTVGQRLKAFCNGGTKEKVDLLVTGLYGRTYEQYEKNEKKHNIGSKSDLSLRVEY